MSTASRRSPTSTSTANSILTSRSMFARHAIEVGHRLRGRNEIIDPLSRTRSGAAGPTKAAGALADTAGAPTATCAGSGRRSWVEPQAFAPGPPAVGPWRPVWLERRRGIAVTSLDLRPGLEGDDGILSVELDLDLAGEVPRPGRRRGRRPDRQPSGSLEVVARDGGQRCPAGGYEYLVSRGGGPTPTASPPCTTSGSRSTHGEPVRIDGGRVGFRELAAGPDRGSAIDTRRTRPARQRRPDIRARRGLDARGPRSA